MSTGSAKKAMVYRFERETLAGFVDSSLETVSGQLPVLTPSGVLQQVPLEQVKVICFTREWGDFPPWQRNQYAVRPRQQGLWVRLQFQDGEQLEATMANNLSLLDPVFVAISPPEMGAGVQRLLVPRQALAGFEVLGVVGSPLKKARVKTQNQLSMFD